MSDQFTTSERPENALIHKCYHMVMEQRNMERKIPRVGCFWREAARSARYEYPSYPRD